VGRLKLGAAALLALALWAGPAWAETYYLSDADLSAGYLETLATSAPSSLDEAQGWQVNQKGVNNFCIYYPDATIGRTDAKWVTTEPAAFSQRGYRTSGTLNGTFANSDWVVSFKVKNNTYTTQKGYVKFRLWRSANADGSGAAQITPGWQASTEISFSAQNQYQTGSITWSPGAEKVLTNEYLFLEIEWSCSNTGGNNNAAVYWAHNEGAAEKLDAPAFTPAPVTGTGAMILAAHHAAGSGICGAGVPRLERVFKEIGETRALKEAGEARRLREPGETRRWRAP